MLILSFYFAAFSQTQFQVVPKQYSFEVGSRFNYINHFNQGNEVGYSVLLDYAWQLSGFNKMKAASYISVPLGYSYFYRPDTSFSILSYGWTVRHHLTKGKKIMPFIGYSLLLNQMRINEIEGSIMGHKTALGFGFEYNTNFLIKPYLRFEYSYSRFGILGQKHGKKLQSIEVILGIRIK